MPAKSDLVDILQEEIKKETKFEPAVLLSNCASHVKRFSTMNTKNILGVNMQVRNSKESQFHKILKGIRFFYMH